MVSGYQKSQAFAAQPRPRLPPQLRLLQLPPLFLNLYSNSYDQYNMDRNNPWCTFGYWIKSINSQMATEEVSFPTGNCRLHEDVYRGQFCASPASGTTQEDGGSRNTNTP